MLSRGIRVNTLSPGVATPIYGKLGLSPKELKQMGDAILPQLPIGRFGSPTEIARAAVYFAGDESAYAVGSELVLDGGFTTV